MSVHIYHYNTNSEQRFFLGQNRELYNLIALNGNIVSHMPDGIASFISTANKNFYIDPQTHAFQHSTINLKRDVSNKKEREPPKFEFKPSIRKLAQERLGSPFSLVIEEDRPIRTTDFFRNDGEIDDDLITNICQNVIRFQLETIINSLDEETKEFLNSEDDFRPEFVIAPYFYLSPRQFREWLKINIECYKKSCEIFQNIQIYLSLVVSKKVLQRGDEIISAISELKPMGILIWIDEHIEEDLIENDISIYTKFLRKLKTHTDIIYNNHGGYLSILLCHKEIGSLLNGVGHSINYGENRSVIPIGGGIPMARFYLPSVHSRLRFGDALHIVKDSKGWLNSIDDYRENVCCCTQCMELIKEKKGDIVKAFDAYGESYPVTFRRRSGTVISLEYPTKEARMIAARHYLFNKAKEFSDLEEFPFKILLQKLENAYDEISPYLGDELMAHLLSWKLALEDIK